MLLSIDQVDIEGFKCFRDRVVINLQSYGHGLHFLRGRNEVEPRLGSNGSGKSSLLDALCWCLYGRTPDGLRNPDIIPWVSVDRTCVQVQVRLDKNVSVIAREANPNRILLNDKAVDQDHIDKLLRINFDIFCHTILLGQDQPLFFDLPPRSKLELFSTVLDLDRWDSRSALASNKASELQREVDTLQGKLDGFINQQDQITTLISKTKKLSDGWEQERISRLETVDTELGQLRKQLEVVSLKHGKADLALDSAQTELRPLQKQIRDLQVKQNKVESEYRTELAVMTRDLERMLSELKTLGNATHCPTCGQSLKGTNLEKHKLELGGKIAILDDTIEHKKPPQEVNDIKKKITILTKSEKAFQDKADDAQSQLAIVAPQVGELAGKIQELVSFQKERRDTINPYHDQLQDLRRRKNKLIAQHREDQAILKQLLRRIERTSYWIKGFKDLKLYVMEEVLQQLELTTNVMLADVGLVDWSVSYGIERETKSGSTQRGLNVRVRSPGNDKIVRWESWSGGEGQRLRLVSALAFGEVLLNYVNCNPTIEILDEPSRSLSTKGLGDLVEFLSGRANQLHKQIWLVDHHVIQSTRLVSTTTVIKDAKGSRIEVQG